MDATAEDKTFEDHNLADHDLAETILNTVSALVVVLNRKGEIVGFNGACQKATGYSLAEVQGRCPWDFLLVPNEADLVRREFSRLTAGHFPSEFENIWIAKDGSLRQIAWSNAAVTDPAGEVLLVIGTGIDLSDLRKAGEALHKSETKNRALLDAIPDMIFQISGDGHFIDFSGPADGPLLAPPEMFLGKAVGEVLPPQLTTLTLHMANLAIETGQPQAYEYHLEADGETRYYESRLVKCGENECLAIVRDITARIRANEALRRHDAILEVVSFGAKRFLESSTWEEHAGEFLPRLGKAAGVSRAYIFENNASTNGRLLSGMRFEWVDQGIPALIDDPNYNSLDYSHEGIARLEQVLSQGGIVRGRAYEFQEQERAILGEKNVLAMLVVPIFAGQEWWGFIGFDECRNDRVWTNAESEALEAAAGIVGTAIERSRVSKVIISAVRISDAAHFAQNLDALYKAIHDIISELMPARNVYIALYDSRKNLVSFPYFVDEFDEPEAPKSLGRGLTEYVLRTGSPLLASPGVFDELVAAGEVESLGTPSIDWLGVPLKTQEKTVGVLVVQSYTPGVRFGEEHKDILELVSSQVAMAIERKRSEEALRASEERYRSLVETSLDAITLTDMQGNVLLCNRQAALLHGFHNPAEVIGQTVFNFFSPESQASALENMQRTLELGGMRDLEYVVQRSDGARFQVELSVSVVRDESGAPIGFLGVERDITERKHREMEREAIIAVASALRSAPTRAEMPPVILASLKNLLNADSVAMLFSCDNGDVLVELSCGRWEGLTGLRLDPAGTFFGKVLMDRQTFHLRAGQSVPAGIVLAPFDGLPSLACVAMTAQNQPLGTLCVGRETDLLEDEVRILAAIGDMAANALHRATLHEQTQRRVQHLAALRAVDMAISSSLDIRVTLNVLLDQLTVQLGVDAADILLYNPHIRTLDFAAGRGFRTLGINRSSIRLGESFAGRAVLDRRTYHITNLIEEAPSFMRERGLGSEGFITYYGVPLMAKGQLKGLLEVFGRAELNPDSEWIDFLETMGGQAAIAVDNASMFTELQRSNMELALAYDTTLEGWVHALDLRDQETEGHTQRVTDVTLRLARSMGKSETELVHVRRGVLLHDIGKIAIPDAILQKPGPLNEREWEIMRRHPDYAYDLLSPISYLQSAIDIPYCHHERWDGSGYPRGLHGEQIPLTARIFAVVDVWDALRSDRPYRKGWEDDKVQAYIREQAGRHFDPEVVRLFLPLILEM